MASDEQTARLAAAFDAGSRAYAAYLDEPAGWLRGEVVWAGLAAALTGRWPSADAAIGGGRPLSVLDAGAGTGRLAVRLLAAGHHVWLVDLSPGMLALAAEQIATLGADAQARAELIEAPIEHLSTALGERQFDVVLCHTVLEFVDEPLVVIERLIERLAPGGLLSLSVLNQAALPLHQAVVRRDWSAALAALSAEVGHDGLFGLRRRAFAPEVLVERLSERGLRLLGLEGVRILDNLLPAEATAAPADRVAVLGLELALRGRRPYCQLGRYSHLLLERPPTAGLGGPGGWLVSG